jgi:hypothetical protein
MLQDRGNGTTSYMDGVNTLSGRALTGGQHPFS